jgi:aspartyl-tRNA(Asn)/glutamyl-tRNA(Gln) amidotransferase subunit B
VSDFSVPAAELGALLREVQAGRVSGSAAKAVFAHMVETGGPPADIIAQLGLAQISDRDELEGAVNRVLAREAEQVEAYRGGKTRVFGYLVGQVMKETGGKAHPGMVNQLLQDKLGSGSE